MKLLAVDTPVETPICPSDLPWLDTPLDGGFRKGGCYLISGAPGANKTTMAVQAATNIAARGVHVLLVLTEQTPADLQDVVGRVYPGGLTAVPSAVWDNLDYKMLDRAEDLLSLLRRTIPMRYPETKVIIIDSLQGTGLASTSSTVYRQVFSFLDDSKARGIITLIVTHVTKDGKIAGPKALEHKVDVAITLRKAYKFRHLFICKNRFGPEVVEPIVLTVEGGRLDLSPHASASCASAMGYSGADDELIEVQAAVSIPKLGGRAELTAPFLPTKRVKQIISTISKIRDIDMHDLCYAVNAFIPNSRGYLPEMDLPLAMALLSAYLQQPVSPRAVFAGQLDLRLNIRSPRTPYLSALAEVLADEQQGLIERVFVSSGAAGYLAELEPFHGGASLGAQVEIVGVRTLIELLGLVWPAVFGGMTDGPDETQERSDGE